MRDDAGRRWDPWRTVAVTGPDGATTAVRVWLPPLPPPLVDVPPQAPAPAQEDASATPRSAAR